MWACFLFPFQNRCDQNAGMWQRRLYLAHLTTLFRVVQEIPYLRNCLLGWSKGHTWTTFCGIFCMQEPLPKVGVLLACLWQMHKLQIHKLVSRCDHLNISTMYSIFDWKEFELLSYRWAFFESAKVSASEETNGLGKTPVQIMPLRKLSGKFHFLVQFYTSNWNRTYTFIGLTQKELYKRKHESRVEWKKCC